VRYLEDAKAQGDFLVVALNTDESVRELKGAGRPLVPLRDRAEVLRALRCVDVVTAFGEQTLEATLREIRPDVHAKGTDYTRETVPERAVDLELGIEIAICGDAKSRSSSALAARLGPEA
jgi:rfaE bifunctional protein nucleotidyltransferase chain/domain